MASNPVQPGSNNQYIELSRPQKVAVGLTFLIGIILVVGAVIAHFAGLGVAGSAAMGAVGGAAIVLSMIIRCCIGYKEEIPQQQAVISN